MTKPASLKIQMWGNSLAVRIPSAIARAAKLCAGQTVEVSVQELGVSIVPVGRREMTLAERLQSFDPERHGGEAMVTGRVGHESV
jgi:antitoxin MazE